MKEKDCELGALQQDLTKCRCQLMKANKQIKELQERCSMGVSNGNNTSSGFMLPAEFKTKFESFMKQTVSSVLCGVIHRPKTYAYLLQKLLKTHYSQTEAKLNYIISQIAGILKLDESHYKLIYNQILKILQDNHTQLFRFEKQSLIRVLSQCINQDEQIIGVLQNQEFEAMGQELNELIVYMLLQENRWEFVLPQKKIIQYIKKQYTCIDGWIKDQDKAIIVLQALKRQKTTNQHIMHQNLKNFVIPYFDECEKTPIQNEKQQLQPSPKPKEKQDIEKFIPKHEFAFASTVSLQLEPLKSVTSILLTSSDTDQMREEPKQQMLEVQNVQHDKGIRAFSQSQSIKYSTGFDAPQVRKKKTGVGKIAGLLTDPSFSESMVFTKQRSRRQSCSNQQIEDEFESRIVNRQHRVNDKKQDRIKKEKSIGRIIHQLSKISTRDQPIVGITIVPSHSHNRCVSNKQNVSINNSKQAEYRDLIIRQFTDNSKGVLKIRDMNERKQLSSFGEPFTAKTERINKDAETSRRRQENRPLKPRIEHVRKVREKHHLL